MPELPEVETIRQDLIKHILNQDIVSVVIHKEKIVKNPINLFKKTLLHNSFTEINRRGKLIILSLKHHQYSLLVHLKMTGQLIYINQKTSVVGGHSFSSQNLSSPDKHTHIVLTFQNGSILFFNDLRQFGYWQLVTESEKKLQLQKYGIEPLTPDFTFANFQKTIQNKTSSIKNILLNQKYIAGLGNIYVDEVLHLSKIHPLTSCNVLNQDQLKILHQNINKIIKLAIKHRGTTFNNYRDTQGQKGNFSNLLKVYSKKDTECTLCHRAKIKKIKIAGRGTHFCPNCQKALPKKYPTK